MCSLGVRIRACGDADVSADKGDISDGQAQGIRDRIDPQVADRRLARAQHGRRQIGNHLVDKSSLEERSRQGRPALEEGVVNASSGNLRQRCAQIMRCHDEGGRLVIQHVRPRRQLTPSDHHPQGLDGASGRAVRGP